MAYTVTVDREACDGVFACLVRDDRFVEDAEGLADVDPTDAVAVERTAERVAATFENGGRSAAEDAAAACPLDAITVSNADADDRSAETPTPEDPPTGGDA